MMQARSLNVECQILILPYIYKYITRVKTSYQKSVQLGELMQSIEWRKMPMNCEYHKAF